MDVESSSLKRERAEDDGTEERAAKKPFVAEPDAEADAVIVDEGVKEKLRFDVGDRVLCNISTKRNGFLWKRGVVHDHNHTIQGQSVAYIIQFDDGSLGGAPEDEDECIRLAARCTLDTRVMRLSAVEAKEQPLVKLRFSEGDRVAVQLDVGQWEEGYVLEVWSQPSRSGKVFKNWVGVAVPYCIRLDIDKDVMVPWDADDVIRPEKAKLPPQKTIAEIIGGTEVRKAAAPRFVVQKSETSATGWIRLDTVTRKEKPCDPPSDDEME